METQTSPHVNVPMTHGSPGSVLGWAATRFTQVLPWLIWLVTLVAVVSFGATARGPAWPDTLAATGWIVGVLAMASTGAVVMTRGQAQGPGRLLMVSSSCMAVGFLAYGSVTGNTVADAGSLAAARRAIAVGEIAFVLAFNALVLLLLIAPDGRLPSPRWRPTLWFLVFEAATWIVASILTASTVVDPRAWVARGNWLSNAGAEPGALASLLSELGTASGVLVAASVMAALAVRFRRSQGEERQQLKWVLTGGVIFLAWLWLWVPQPEAEWAARAQGLLPGLGLVSLATGLGMALLRYRLWDVDVVVRRSLVYGVLWLSIAAVYAAIAGAFGIVAGARFPVEVAIGLTVLATLVFQPARERLEQFADRWVFGRNTTPAEALHALGDAAPDSEQPEALAARLVTSARAAVGLVSAEAVLGGATVTSGATDGSSSEEIPITWRQERFGTLRYRVHHGRELTDEDRTLLAALASHVALAMSRARLASRILHAQEEERRRIERDIHDGAQQELAALIARVGLARTTGHHDASTRATLAAIQADVQRILADVRALSHGILPPVLRDRGIVAGIEDRCSRLPLDVALDVDDGLRRRRFTAEVEAAAYFFVTEALANAVKHAGARGVSIRLGCHGQLLLIEVQDDGGGAELPDGTGTGLQNLADRVRALGGVMSVDSQPGAGTRLRATLPTATRSDQVL